MTPLLFLFACEPRAAVESDGDDTAAPPAGSTLVVATVASDFSAGQLATLAPNGALTDAILPITTDPVVESDGDRVFLLDRSSENTVRMYDPGDWSAPLVELSTGDASNPQDAARCGDTLVVTTYAGDALRLFDATTGLPTGTADLSPWADDDGSPEAEALLRGPDGALYIALNRLETRAFPWRSADGTGAILRFSCASLTVTAEWITGPNPTLLVDPTDADRFLVRTGDYFDADYALALDGALQVFDPAAGTLAEPRLTEADFGLNLGAVAGNTDGKAILVADDAYTWSVWCLDLATWETTPTPAVDAYIGDAVADADGTVWAAYRPGYAGTGDPVVEGLVAWDPAACAASDPVPTLFPPYSLAAIP